MTTESDLKEIRKELVDAHLEYDKKMTKVWEKINKMIKDTTCVSTLRSPK